jgi:hypothetical protein
MNGLAKAMGKTVQWTDIDFKGLPGLIAHRFEVAISAIYITRQGGRFHRPVLRRRPCRTGENRFADQSAH